MEHVNDQPSACKQPRQAIAPTNDLVAELITATESVCKALSAMPVVDNMDARARSGMPLMTWHDSARINAMRITREFASVPYLYKNMPHIYANYTKENMESLPDVVQMRAMTQPMVQALSDNVRTALSDFGSVCQKHAQSDHHIARTLMPVMASTIHSLSDPQARADALASRMQFPTHITPELATAYNDVVNDAARLPKSDDAYRCVVLVTFILHRCSDGRPYMRLEQLQSAEDMKPFSEHVGRMFSDATHPLRIPASCRASFRRLADAARRITPPRASTYYTELADAIDGAMESQPAHPGQ